MKAFLLAAGYGERLRPITNFMPKPLVPVLNVPAVCYALTLLKEAGITDVVCNLHHLPGQIEEFFRSHDNFGMNVVFSREPAILGTGGGLANCREELGGGPFVYINSDIIADIDIRTLAAALGDAGAGGALAVRRTAPGSGRVAVSDGRVVNLRNISARDPSARSRFPRRGGALALDLRPSRRRLFRYRGNRPHPPGAGRRARLPRVRRDVARHRHNRVVPRRERRAYRYGMQDTRAGCGTLPGSGRRPFQKARRSGQAHGSGARSSGTAATIGEGAVVEESVLLPGARVAPGESVTREVRWT